MPRFKLLVLLAAAMLAAAVVSARGDIHSCSNGSVQTTTPSGKSVKGSVKETTAKKTTAKKTTVKKTDRRERAAKPKATKSPKVTKTKSPTKAKSVKAATTTKPQSVKKTNSPTKAKSVKAATTTKPQSVKKAKSVKGATTTKPQSVKKTNSPTKAKSVKGATTTKPKSVKNKSPKTASGDFTCDATWTIKGPDDIACDNEFRDCDQVDSVVIEWNDKDVAFSCSDCFANLEVIDNELTIGTKSGSKTGIDAAVFGALTEVGGKITISSGKVSLPELGEVVDMWVGGKTLHGNVGPVDIATAAGVTVKKLTLKVGAQNSNGNGQVTFKPITVGHVTHVLSLDVDVKLPVDTITINSKNGGRCTGGSGGQGGTTIDEIKVQGQTKHAELQGVVANGVDSLGQLTVTENAGAKILAITVNGGTNGVTFGNSVCTSVNKQETCAAFSACTSGQGTDAKTTAAPDAQGGTGGGGGGGGETGAGDATTAATDKVTSGPNTDPTPSVTDKVTSGPNPDPTPSATLAPARTPAPVVAVTAGTSDTGADVQGTACALNCINGGRCVLVSDVPTCQCGAPASGACFYGAQCESKTACPPGTVTCTPFTQSGRGAFDASNVCSTAEQTKTGQPGQPEEANAGGSFRTGTNPGAVGGGTNSNFDLKVVVEDGSKPVAKDVCDLDCSDGARCVLAKRDCSDPESPFDVPTCASADAASACSIVPVCDLDCNDGARCVLAKRDCSDPESPFDVPTCASADTASACTVVPPVAVLGGDAGAGGETGAWLQESPNGVGAASGDKPQDGDAGGGAVAAIVILLLLGALVAAVVAYMKRKGAAGKELDGLELGSNMSNFTMGAGRTSKGKGAKARQDREVNTKTNPVYDLGDNNTAAADDLYTLASQEPAADEGDGYLQVAGTAGTMTNEAVVFDAGEEEAFGFGEDEGMYTLAAQEPAADEGMYTLAAQEPAADEGMYTLATQEPAADEGLYTLAAQQPAADEGMYALASNETTGWNVGKLDLSDRTETDTSGVVDTLTKRHGFGTDTLMKSSHEFTLEKQLRSVDDSRFDTVIGLDTTVTTASTVKSAAGVFKSQSVKTKKSSTKKKKSTKKSTKKSKKAAGSGFAF